MRTHPRPPHRGLAFTLVELLVVVSIIGLLMAILIPALSYARNKAKTVACATNLRSIDTAYRMYADQENNGHFGRTNTGLPGTFWFYLAQPYLGNQQKTYICPVAKDPASTTDDDTNAQWGSITRIWDGYVNNGRWIKYVNPNKQNGSYIGSTNPNGLVGIDKSSGADYNLASGNTRSVAVGYTGSYGNNAWMDNGGGQPQQSAVPGASGFSSFVQIERGDTVLFMDCNWANTSGTNTGDTMVPGALTAAPTGGNVYPGFIQQTPDSTGSFMNGQRSNDSISRCFLNRHNKAINMAFADGSARTVSLSDIWNVAWFNGWQNTPMYAPLLVK